MLSPDDPVYVVDLTAGALRQTLRVLGRDPASAADIVARDADAGAGADTQHDVASAGAAAERRSLAAERELSEAYEADGAPRVRALAFVFDWDDDPVVLALEPTSDIEMLGTLARLLRCAYVIGSPLALLVNDHGDARMRELYFARRFPRFVYDGVPHTLSARMPPTFYQVVKARRRV